MKFHLIWLFSMYLLTSSARTIFFITEDADWNTLALSEIMTLGMPLREVNRLNARRNVAALKSGVNSKCTALVAAHAKRHT